MAYAVRDHRTINHLIDGVYPDYAFTYFFCMYFYSFMHSSFARRDSLCFSHAPSTHVSSSCNIKSDYLRSSSLVFPSLLRQRLINYQMYTLDSLPSRMVAGAPAGYNPQTYVRNTTYSFPSYAARMDMTSSEMEIRDPEERRQTVRRRFIGCDSTLLGGITLARIDLDKDLAAITADHLNPDEVFRHVRKNFDGNNFDGRRTRRMNHVYGLWDEIYYQSATMIHGSNHIEGVGRDAQATNDIALAVLEHGGWPDNVEEHCAQFQEHDSREDREIRQHAQAWEYLVDHVVRLECRWSTKLIRETHRILYHRLEDERSDVRPGEFRTDRCAARWTDPDDKAGKVRTTHFIRHQAVKDYMEELVKDINAVTERDSWEYMDPYMLAAQVHNRFIAIHPFGDGNGRMSRLLMNAVLLKFTGHLAPFGGTDEEKEEYLRIVVRGMKIFSEEDMEIETGAFTGHRDFAKFLMKKSRRGLEILDNWALNDGSFVSGWADAPIISRSEE